MDPTYTLTIDGEVIGTGLGLFQASLLADEAKKKKQVVEIDIEMEEQWNDKTDRRILC